SVRTLATGLLHVVPGLLIALLVDVECFPQLVGEVSMLFEFPIDMVSAELEHPHRDAVEALTPRVLGRRLHAREFTGQGCLLTETPDSPLGRLHDGFGALGVQLEPTVDRLADGRHGAGQPAALGGRSLLTLDGEGELVPEVRTSGRLTRVLTHRLTSPVSVRAQLQRKPRVAGRPPSAGETGKHTQLHHN